MSGSLAEALAAAGLTPAFGSALAEVIADIAYREALAGATDGLGGLRLAVARAVVAQALINQAEDDDSPVIPDAAARDRVVVVLVDALGGVDMGLGGAVAAHARGLALRMVSRRLRRRRGAITDAAYPAAGDILLYQARGDGIRSFIADLVEAAAPPVVLLTHSLGGIAAVDLLASRAMPTVRLLVTVGSQAPFLYEIGALWSLSHTESLPTGFPRWLNVYDPRDVLSYLGARVFPGRVEDVEVDNGQPFPQSHSAYWTNRTVWDEIVARLP